MFKEFKMRSIIIFFPLILTMIISILWVNYFFSEMRNYSKQSLLELSRRQEIIEPLYNTAASVSDIQLKVDNIIEKINENDISMFQIYEKHKEIVDKLGDDYTELKKISEKDGLTKEEKEVLSIMIDNFDNYRSNIIATTDIITIDPVVANDYLSSAKNYYIEYSRYSNKLIEMISKVQGNIFLDQIEKEDEIFSEMLYYLILGLLIIFALTMMITNYFNNYILGIAKKAEEANKTKSQFLANMSHEIRTPLNAIINLVNLTLNTELNQQQEDYLKKANVSSKALLHVINDILDFSKIEADKLSLEAIAFQMDQILSDLGDLVSIKARDKGLELLFLRDPKLPNSLIGSPQHLKQILINLVNNAIKFTKSGHIIVEIKEVEGNQGEVVLQFSVEDTGIGMSEQQQKKLFKSFSQVDASKTREFGGTGLGLAISKRLVEMMNGQIWVESELNHGSTFFFTVQFPLVEKKEESLVAQDLKGLKVLVTDDNPKALEIFKVYLESFSCVVTTAESGKEALTKLTEAKEKFDLLLVDYSMPDLDGLGMSTKVVRQIDNPPKIILVSAFSSGEMLDKDDLQKYTDAVLIKPVTPSHLFDSIMNLFEYSVESSSLDENLNLARIDLSSIKGANILVVEDNEINQLICRELLEEKQLQVELANNGVEALEMIEEESFDCVLMDVQMPVMNGYEATRRIRNNKNLAELPVLALTADAMPEHKKEAREAGMNDHISKPIEPDELFVTLAKHITEIEEDLSCQDDNFKEEKDSSLEQLADIVGLDTELGIARIGGNLKTYKKLLKKFASKQADRDLELRNAVNRDDYHSLKKIAHALKGVAGNIGATDLEELSRDLEQATQEAVKEQVEEKVELVREELIKVITSINSAELAIELEKKAEYINQNQLLAELEQLKELINKYDTQALDLLEEILAKVEESKIEESLVEIEESLVGYDFEVAQEKLIKLIKKVGDLKDE